MKFKEKQKYLEFLKDNGYLEFGHIIPKGIFEQLFEMEYCDNWDFLGPFLEMKDFIEEHGYLCTSRGMTPGFLQIISEQEFSKRMANLHKNNFNRIHKLHRVISNTKADQFSKKDFEKFMHEANKINSSLNALKSALNSI
jgi:hypothetical protein